jgi:hypothetical protein
VRVRQIYALRSWRRQPWRAPIATVAFNSPGSTLHTPQAASADPRSHGCPDTPEGVESATEDDEESEAQLAEEEENFPLTEIDKIGTSAAPSA